ncbi:MAG: hypothetical protein NTY19_22660, partial [Planctomycetota bacterium]|nr:hypothetical protein [Planctomycetota bacterium]
ARGNPPRSGELCVAGCVSAKKCLSLAVLIRQAARVRRAAAYLNHRMHRSRVPALAKWKDHPARPGDP